ncbi:alpha/beta family hydrolase [Paeniglutamicibacter sp. NPDC012692]|uniref:alpha/beta hydrolase family protein n=1 Tax=Paeniglutamicibacter sp. NPDC012692 TaxID=3364388 RepID=UPI00368E2AB6
MSAIEESFSMAVGDTAVSAVFANPAGSVATVVVAHGAGAGMDHPFLTGFTGALNERGIATMRFNFPYSEAGKKFPDRPPVAIATWNVAMDAARQRAAGQPVFAAGKSFGGRMASMAVAEGMETAGLVFLGYPLHAPGKPEKLRDGHLYGLDVPMLFLQGTRDPFALPGELEPVVERIGANTVLRWFEGGDHSFKVARSKRTPEEDGAALADSVVEFVLASS